MFKQEGEDFNKFAFVVTHVDLDQRSKNPEADFPGEVQRAKDRYTNQINEFFESMPPKVWAVSMQNIDTDHPVPAVAEFFETQARAINTAFTSFRTEFFSYSKK